MPKRTDLQNRSLHTYFEELAQALNDSGQDMRKVLKPGVDIPWGKESVKTLMFKPIAEAMFNVKSTTDLTTKQISEVYEVMNRHTQEKLGIGLLWPEGKK